MLFSVNKFLTGDIATELMKHNTWVSKSIGDITDIANRTGDGD
jgi:hypothetical protein